ncbi:hypothetical protein PLICRDRAFT_104049 [Plicaturopsis crispa FD-325 SS-3]|nr:hypothetical protein PLICRDRAFT_104049 [Plicaturopsis crispa FD-325 SS-3]
MPNHDGKNSYGKKNYPPDEVLKDTFLKYARRGLSQSEKLARLRDDHDLSIGLSKLNQLERKLAIPSVRRQIVPPEQVQQAILDEVEKDVTNSNGPNFIKGKLKDQHIMAPRDTIRDAMHTQRPEGFSQRFPGNRSKSNIERQALSAIGPFHEISADGHEKLSSQALRMGLDVGLPIYGYKDKYSDALLMLRVLPDCRTAAALGHVFLDFIQETGCVPIQMTTDKGSETGWQYAFQTALREIFAPEIDPDVYPPWVFLKSVHNTVIEGFWRCWMRKVMGRNLKAYILRGKTDHIFDSNVPWHRDLFNWIFPSIIQAELDEFRTWWNQHRVRYQQDKNMPSGHVPIDVLEHPKSQGGLDCRVRVPAEAIAELREQLVEEVGPRDSHLAWVTAEFAALAGEAYNSVGRPALNLDSAWDVFSAMSNVIQAL